MYNLYIYIPSNFRICIERISFHVSISAGTSNTSNGFLLHCYDIQRFNMIAAHKRTLKVKWGRKENGTRLAVLLGKDFKISLVVLLAMMKTISFHICSMLCPVKTLFNIETRNPFP